MEVARFEQSRRVGELAAATGLTVRTLHYYEEIGLLTPSQRTHAGHRLYDSADLARLYQICLLRRLGLPLAEIGRALDDPSWNLHSALAAHLSHLDRQLEGVGQLRSRLASLLSAEAVDTAAIGSQLLVLLEGMTMLETTLQRRITLLVYVDIAAAQEWLVRVFGLTRGRLDRNEHGTVSHGEVYAGDGVIWMHQEERAAGLASPRSVGAATANVAVLVDDVDAHHLHAVSEGAPVVYEPVDQPYGYRVYSAHDLEGHLWSFMKPLD
jgi:DNA-binding transcriptional MerR regulator